MHVASPRRGSCHSRYEAVVDMRQASAASEAIETEAIETEVSLKVWDVLHPRVAVEGGGRAKRAKRAYRRRPRSSCRRRVRYTMTKRTKFKA